MMRLSGNTTGLSFPHYAKWNDFYIWKRWGGYLIYIQISKLLILLDFRKNPINDLITGVIE